MGGLIEGHALERVAERRTRVEHERQVAFTLDLEVERVAQPDTEAEGHVMIHLVPLDAQPGAHRESGALGVREAEKGQRATWHDDGHGSSVGLDEESEPVGHVYGSAEAPAEAIEREVGGSEFACLVRRSREGKLAVAVRHQPLEELPAELRLDPRRGGCEVAEFPQEREPSKPSLENEPLLGG